MINYNYALNNDHPFSSITFAKPYFIVAFTIHYILVYKLFFNVLLMIFESNNIYTYMDNYQIKMYNTSNSMCPARVYA